MKKARTWKVAVLAALVCALGVGIGVGLAAVGEGGVIKACYSKTGSWRVISTSNPTESCKSGEQMLELYSKSGADAAFLDQAEADASYLGKTAKSADADKLDGMDSTAFATQTQLNDLEARVEALEPQLLTPGGQTVAACPVGEEPRSPTATYSFRNQTRAVVTNHKEFQTEGVVFNASFTTPLEPELDKVVVDLDCVPHPTVTDPFAQTHIDKQIGIGPNTWAIVWCPLPVYRPNMLLVEVAGGNALSVIIGHMEQIPDGRWGVRFDNISSSIALTVVRFPCELPS